MSRRWRLAEQGLAVATEATDRSALTCLQGELLPRPRPDGAFAARPLEAALADGGDDGARRCRAWLGLAAVKRVTDELDGAFADLERGARRAVAPELDRGSWRASTSCAATSTSRAAASKPASPEHRESLRLPGARLARARGPGARRARRRDTPAAASDGATATSQDCAALCERHGLGRIAVANRPMAAITLMSTPAISRAPRAQPRCARRGRARRPSARGDHRLPAVCFSTSSARRPPTSSRSSTLDAGSGAGAAAGRQALRGPVPAFLGDRAGSAGERALGLGAGPRRDRDQPRERHRLYRADRCSARSRASPMTRRSGARRCPRPRPCSPPGTISHNYLWFYHEAIETTLARRLGRPGAMPPRSRTIPASEPLPWAELYIARGRALAACGGGRAHATLWIEPARLGEAGPGRRPAHSRCRRSTRARRRGGANDQSR